MPYLRTSLQPWIVSVSLPSFLSTSLLLLPVLSFSLSHMCVHPSFSFVCTCVCISLSLVCVYVRLCTHLCVHGHTCTQATAFMWRSVLVEASTLSFHNMERLNLGHQTWKQVLSPTESSHQLEIFGLHTMSVFLCTGTKGKFLRWQGTSGGEGLAGHDATLTVCSHCFPWIA